MASKLRRLVSSTRMWRNVERNGALFGERHIPEQQTRHQIAVPSKINTGFSGCSLVSPPLVCLTNLSLNERRKPTPRMVRRSTGYAYVTTGNGFREDPSDLSGEDSSDLNKKPAEQHGGTGKLYRDMPEQTEGVEGVILQQLCLDIELVVKKLILEKLPDGERAEYVHKNGSLVDVKIENLNIRNAMASNSEVYQYVLEKQFQGVHSKYCLFVGTMNKLRDSHSNLGHPRMFRGKPVTYSVVEELIDKSSVEHFRPFLKRKAKEYAQWVYKKGDP